MKNAALTVINFMDLPHDYSATSMFMTKKAENTTFIFKLTKHHQFQLQLICLVLKASWLLGA
ncbi:hypothetical protein [Lacticaseibacillus paracasei]|uniref:Uncharacterized protein n=3 Tax=Lacticaseibacillus paracasei TaxID=1597 RepID=A0A806LKE9_LACPA|nr:hypothetical protein [Lacticaseibacillus paracasei]EPC48828.1 hypothetical protein Lpp7_14150 [Lacticaseibacillus paracasei subsp. paracasei Lpp7]EPC71437.1 hypothetical protein Lpp71_13290 [Lacticaseibacillus paracasei subsp. paracasei Lpp71]OJF73766.1 hypothetical protein BOQ55_09495 [Lacticaseibacillus casei]PTS55723.1 hypothetical protein DBQ61_11865 [Lactobacillus sp. DS22_6]AHJ34299.1 hypothetical protein AF91_14520 [Lacticaseibacillus paracasei N1115]